jgi:hypothetical protein
VPRLPKDNTYAKRMEGLNQMRTGLRTMWSGASQFLAEISGAGNQHMVEAIQSLTSNAPRYKRILTAADIQDTNRAIQALTAKSTDSRIRQALTAFSTAVNRTR